MQEQIIENNSENYNFEEERRKYILSYKKGFFRTFKIYLLFLTLFLIITFFILLNFYSQHFFKKSLNIMTIIFYVVLLLSLASVEIWFLVLRHQNVDRDIYLYNLKRELKNKKEIMIFQDYQGIWYILMTSIFNFVVQWLLYFSIYGAYELYNHYQIGRLNEYFFKDILISIFDLNNGRANIMAMGYFLLVISSLTIIIIYKSIKRVVLIIYKKVLSK